MRSDLYYLSFTGRSAPEQDTLLFYKPGLGVIPVMVFQGLGMFSFFHKCPEYVRQFASLHAIILLLLGLFSRVSLECHILPNTPHS